MTTFGDEFRREYARSPQTSTPTRRPVSCEIPGKQTLACLFGGWAIGIGAFAAGVLLDFRSTPFHFSPIEFLGVAILIGLFFGLMAAQIALTSAHECVDHKAVLAGMFIGLISGALVGGVISRTLAGAVWNAPGGALIWGLIAAKWGPRRACSAAGIDHSIR